MRYFILTHQNPNIESGHGKVNDDGTCEVILKPGMCPLKSANKIQKFNSLIEVLEIDTVMGFRWEGHTPFNPKTFENPPKGVIPESNHIAKRFKKNLKQKWIRYGYKSRFWHIGWRFSIIQKCLTDKARYKEIPGHLRAIFLVAIGK